MSIHSIVAGSWKPGVKYRTACIQIRISCRNSFCPPIRPLQIDCFQPPPSLPASLHVHPSQSQRWATIRVIAISPALGYRRLVLVLLILPPLGSSSSFLFPLSSFLSPASFASQASREVTCSSIIHFSLGFFFLISTCSVGLQFCNFRLIKYS